MDQTGIVYATKTGHSRKLAEAIGRALQVKAENIAANPALRPVELLFLVGGIYGGKSMPKLIRFAESLSAGQAKKAVLVTSSVSESLRGQSDIRRILEAKGIGVIEEITCTGSFLFIKPGRPNPAEISQAAQRAKQIAKQHGTVNG